MHGEGTQAAATEAFTFNCEEGENSGLDEEREGLDEDEWVLIGEKRRQRRGWSEEKRDKGGGVRTVLLLEIERSIHLRRGRVEKYLE